MSCKPMTLCVVVVLALVGACHAVGCGEPVPSGMSASTACSDWQCSRAAPVFSAAVPPLPNTTTYFCVRGYDEGEGPCEGNNDCYHELVCEPKSELCVKGGDDGKNAAVGYAAIAVAVMFFGSNFIPVKHHVTGNGLYFQFVMSIPILLVGIIVQLVRQSPYIYPFAMLGGMFWALGNTLSVPVIQCLGIGLSITLWGSTNMIMGWCSGKFGFFGIEPEAYAIEWMSWVGVALGIVRILLFGLVKPTPNAHKEKKSGSDIEAAADSESTNLLAKAPSGHTVQEDPAAVDAFPLTTDNIAPATFEEACPANVRRGLGVVGALTAGVFFGLNFDPAQSLMGKYGSKSLTEDVKYSPNGLDYVFSTNLGIFVTASGLLFIFSLIQDRVPTYFPPVDHGKLFAPAFISGLMWAIANTAWFVANTNLGLMVSFPVLCLGPSLVASIWGVVLYKEIQGRRNFIILAAAFFVVGLSCFFTVFGKHGA